jgi:hypothetical protein
VRRDDGSGGKRQPSRREMSANGSGCRKTLCARRSGLSEEDVGQKEQFVRKSLSSEEDVSLKEQFVRKSLSSEEWRVLK